MTTLLLIEQRRRLLEALKEAVTLYEAEALVAEPHLQPGFGLRVGQWINQAREIIALCEEGVV